MTIRNYQLERATQRLKLAIARKPYWVAVAGGIFLGYRRNEKFGTWSVRTAGKLKRFAFADDHEPSNGRSVLTYFEALRAAIEIGRRGVEISGSVCLEQQIATKAAGFIKDDIQAACWLYRHYDHAGDLIYVGISLSPLRRHEKHFATAAHRHQIFKILIEPFASREEALQAEETAIRDEFPKFNARHNRRRHPALELRRLERSRGLGG
jgi:hypothetical protein